MSETLTIENRVTNNETREHIAAVGHLMHTLVKEMLDRCDKHDLSKLDHPEVDGFTRMTPTLAQSEYGSEENVKNREAMLADTLLNHYAKNRHHPQHFPDGVDGMNLVDLIEMFCDWKASSARHKNGNIRKSIDHNRDRFKMAPQLARIFYNTIDLVGE